MTDTTLTGAAILLFGAILGPVVTALAWAVKEYISSLKASNQYLEQRDEKQMEQLRATIGVMKTGLDTVLAISERLERMLGDVRRSR